MPVYTAPALDVAYQYFTSTLAWSRDTSAGPSVYADPRALVLLFQDAYLPPGATVASATLYAESYSSSGSINASVGLAGGLPADPDGQTIDVRPTSSVQEFLRTSGTTWDLTALVQAAADDASRTVGAPLAVLLQRSGGGSRDVRRSSVTFTVEWELPPVNLDADPIVLDLTVPAAQVSQQRTLTADPITLDLTVPVPVLTGPVGITADPILLDLTVPEAGMVGTGDAPTLHADPIVLDLTVPDATITITIPPPPAPPPWQETIADPAFQAALVARTATIDTRVEVVNEDDTVIALLGGPDATHPGVIGGSVTMDTGRDVRWTCDLTIDQADLVPTQPGDLLHPLAYNRVRIWWRILTDQATGQWAEIPVGTYYTTWPTVNDNGNANLSVSITGSDAASHIARALMGASVEVGGLTVTDAVTAILSEAAPWATLNLDPSDHQLPAEYEAGEPGGNPWQVCQELATSAGMVLYVDRMGDVRLTDAPSPQATPTAQFIEGPGCVMSGVSATIPLDQIANQVIVTSTATQDADGNDIEPVTATATVDDATHPLWVGHGHTWTARVDTDQVTTKAQAQKLANTELAKRSALTEENELIIPPHPHLDGGDVVQVSTDRAGVSGARQVAAWSLTLGDLGGQRVTVNGRRDW